MRQPLTTHCKTTEHQCPVVKEIVPVSVPKPVPPDGTRVGGKIRYPFVVPPGCTATEWRNQPNKGLQATAYSLCSFLAPASGSA